ncbi:hypothetical protein COV19_02765 [Candidatus Woesearchaeota archaeon CG10_big_fil_rev_8_21_14_0_10_44_13]|nr:MAG: hypothetical protein COV19_02765 [Candidatus Woesearchaeota archaeon CG10_big_fil_rev_8_21_14_0_10_44_13]
MSIRKKLNETIRKMPYVGKALIREVGIKEIGTTAIGVYMTLVNPIPALGVGGSVEVISGVDAESNTSTTIDVKLGGGIAERVNFFFRNMTTIGHDNMVDSFTLMDLVYVLGHGFDAVAETQYAPGEEIDPRLGMQYFKDIGKDMAVYALITRNFSENPNTEAILLLKYSPLINKKTRLLAQWEPLLNMGDKQYNFDLQKIRLGVEYKGVGFGAAADIAGAWNGEPNYAVGGFILLRIK